MRLLMKISLANGAYSAAVQDGSAGRKTAAILEETQPEAVYFTELDGLRTVVMIVELGDAAEIPRLAEPWFLGFDARVELHPVMSRADLENAGFDRIAEQWAAA